MALPDLYGLRQLETRKGDRLLTEEHGEAGVLVCWTLILLLDLVPRWLRLKAAGSGCSQERLGNSDR